MADINDNNFLLGGGNPLVLLTPGHASMLAEQGYTKQRVKECLFEHAKVPLSRFPSETSVIDYEEGFVRDGDLVCPCRSPDDVLVVAGGPEPYHAVYCGDFGDTWAVTKPLELPDWGKNRTVLYAQAPASRA